MTRVRLRRLCGAAVVVVAIGLSAATPVSAPGSVRHARAVSPCRGLAPPVRYRHVIWIVFENQGYDKVIGNHADLPYTNALSNACGLATNYFGVGDPSLPNYIAMTSGGTQGVTGDSSRPLAVPSIFSQVAARHWQWRSYSESMPSNCFLADYPSGQPVYTAHHEPVVYYSGIRSQCRRWDVPLGTVSDGALASDLENDTLPAFAIIGPNDDGGTAKPGCSRPCGNVDPPLSDVFLRDWMSKIVSSRAYRAGGTAIFITWDEDDVFTDSLCPALDCDHLATVVVAPSVRRATRSGVLSSHFSLLRTTEELLGIRQYLGDAATANSMSQAFRLLPR
jgi:phospholipase C